ncbi:MAG: hypothetical protein WC710_03905 [Gallionella sp.]
MRQVYSLLRTQSGTDAKAAARCSGCVPPACAIPVRLRHVTDEASLHQPFAGAASEAGLANL